jgi:hypothetical protein
VVKNDENAIVKGMKSFIEAKWSLTEVWCWNGASKEASKVFE